MSPSVLAVGCACLLGQLAAGISLHAQQAQQPAPTAGQPPQPQLLETWQLARADGVSTNGSRARRMVWSNEDMDQKIMNLTEPGLCYAAPLEATVRDNWDKVLANVERGKAAVANKTVVFAGLIRNAGMAVRSSYLMLSRLGRYFKDYNFVLLENDSEDDTVKHLREVAREDKRFHFVSHTLRMGNERGLERERMQRMANLRNMLHEEIQNFVSGMSHHREPRFGGIFSRTSPDPPKDWDLIVMYDFDLNLFGDDVVSPHGFLGVFGRPISMWDKWDMVCANSLRHDRNDPSREIGYHDCFAYRPTFDDSFNGFTCGDIMGHKLFSDFHPFRVHSCFGGLAIYKADKFLSCKYNPTVYDCEHVPFHTCMRENGSEERMFLDPLLTTLYSADIPQRCNKKPNNIRGFEYHWKDMPGFSVPR